MKNRGQQVLGILLILLGLAVLIRKAGVLNWALIRSYGFLLLGGGLLVHHLVSTPRRGLYWPSVLFLSGVYFLGNRWGLWPGERGLTISVITLILGVASYIKFIFQERHWEDLIWGNVILLLGFLFFFDYLGIIPGSVLIQLVDVYWPVFLILIGLGLVIAALLNRKQAPSAPPPLSKSSQSES
ncbi:MAG: hypothetical protein D6715_04110 [Calditrichaeota bacterium]|nr:MAG: hypothetical protein D6715_04110 [Calditrichota bacterium]